MSYQVKVFVFFVFLFVLNNVSAQMRVACIGDSVTKGYGLKDSTTSYPYLLQQMLGAEYEVRNFGYSGATLLRKGHNPYVKTQAYQEAIAFVPDIIIISLGLNDTDPRNWPNYSNEFTGDYSDLIHDFKKVNPAVEVYICTLTPIFSGHPRFLSGTRDWFDEIQGIIPDIAVANKASLINNHSILASRIDLFADFLHPNVQGAAILANNVYNYLVPIQQRLKVLESIGSHMVLQRQVKNNIMGMGNANEEVRLLFNNKKYKVKASNLGKWNVELPEMNAGGPYTIKVYSKTDSIIVEDILFGDVFLASGQSNMAFQLQAMKNAHSYTAEGVNMPRNIRLFKNKNSVETSNTVWNTQTLQEVNDLTFFEGQWESPTSDNIKSFSAIAYVFAEEINRTIDVPIGIIDLSVGGSNTESWIPRKTLEQDDLLSTYIHNWRKSDFVQDFCRDRGAKNIELATSKNQRHPYDPAYNFEAGIQKWLSTQLKGILWYQGESNAHNIGHHEYLFAKLVASWRSSFNQQLPFYFVQLSSINRPSWGYFRDSQRLLAQKIPNVYMAVSSDVGNPTDVHPVEKEIIGKRLANLVKQHSYKLPIQALSPSPVTYKKHKGMITITFNNCKGLKLTKGTQINDLHVLDIYGHSIPVEEVHIIKNTIQFKEPNTGATSLQYAFTPFTEGNLRSDTDVPVSTFNLKLK